jgi:hypothetical protein
MGFEARGEVSDDKPNEVRSGYLKLWLRNFAESADARQFLLPNAIDPTL